MDKNGGGLWLTVARRCNCSNWRTTWFKATGVLKNRPLHGIGRSFWTLSRNLYHNFFYLKTLKYRRTRFTRCRRWTGGLV